MSGEMDESEVGKAKKKPADEDALTDEQKAKKPNPDDEAEEAEKARRRAEGEDPEDADSAKADDDSDEEQPKPRRKAELVLSAELKASLLATLTQAMERLMALAKQIKAAGKPQGDADGALPDDVGAEIEGVVELLGKVTKGGKKKAAKAEVAKGARMGRDRLDRFQKALSLLSDILKELTASKEQPPAPTAGAAEAGVYKGEAQAGSPEVPGLAELVTGIGELTRVVKRQEEELARLRQARGISNAIPVDGGGRRAEPQEVSWPLDMNRPISRDKVRKEVSFFDE